jgi:hypothetical protein
MKTLFAFIILFSAKNTFAQIPYTDFIQNDTAIQWAAEYDQILNITPKINKNGIRNILYGKLIRGECIDNYEALGNKIIKSKYCLADTLKDENIFSSTINPFSKQSFVLGQEKMPRKFKKEIFQNFQDKNTKPSSQVYKIKQILFYKNGKLSITNVLVTALFLKEYSTVSSTPKLSWENYYSTCYNDSLQSLSAEQKSTFIDLGTNYQIYNLFEYGNTDSLESKVITKGKPVLSQQLFKDILAKKITAVDDYGNILLGKKLLTYKGQEIRVQMSDPNGEVYAPTIYINEINIDSIYKFGINQHFYYDSINNKLYSEINHIDTYKKIEVVGIVLGEGSHLRIYFIKPSQYKKRLQKRYLN